MHEVTLSTLSYGGDCLGRLPDGRVVFIPYGVPGERVVIEIVEDNPRYVRGKIVKIIKSSDLRIKPRCDHFGLCGGCHYQHLTYATQLKYKKDILIEQLTRVGKLSNFPRPLVVPSDEPYYYRNNIRFHILADGRPGFLEPHSNRILPISKCHLPENMLNEIWSILTLAAGSGIHQVELRCGTVGDALITLEGEDHQAPGFETEVSLSAVYASPSGRVILAGDDILNLNVKGKDFKVSGDSFFQVNTSQAGKMVNILLDNLELDHQKTLMDLYCGVGLFSAFVAPLVKEVIGIEVSPYACHDYAVNLNESDNVSLYESTVEKALPGITTQADIIILDPPRTGLHLKALAGILKIKPKQIAYVSCDPATLARDLSAMIQSGYQIQNLFLLDLFPQTYHIETIAVLRS